MTARGACTNNNSNDNDNVRADFFHMVGRKNARHEAELVLALETKVATGELERAEQRMDHGTATTWDKIEALAPSWPWQSWLTQVRYILYMCV